ncbi:MAG: DUF4474 domain-containing protein [Oscillospiraceae bacterium]|jgi:hypothetical protein|nr:DUF4474 domain-containing protein [Oscillospiraceae bacterium]
MKKFSVRLTALLLAILLCASVGVSASAAGTTEKWSGKKMAEVFGVLLEDALAQFGSGDGMSPAEIRAIIEKTPFLQGDDAKLKLQPSWNPLCYLTILTDWYFAFLPTEKKDIYKVVAVCTPLLGDRYLWDSDLDYYRSIGTFKRRDGNGIFNGKNYKAENHQTQQAPGTINRLFGFAEWMDSVTPLIDQDLETRRIYFDYNGADWLLQIWKGSYYSISNGAEVGLYDKPKNRWLDHYDCSDIYLNIGIDLYKDNDHIMNYAPEKTWWASAFRFTSKDKVYLAKDLKMISTIAFEDKVMLDAVVKSLKEKPQDGVTYKTKGMVLTLTWK